MLSLFGYFINFFFDVHHLFGRFKIWDLTAENQYLIDLKFSVCFDSASQCLLDVPVFHQQRLPKNICDFAAIFTS